MSAAAVAAALQKASDALAEAAQALRGAPASPAAGVATTPYSPPASSGAVIPGGKSKGTPIESATDRDVSYWVTRLAGDLAAGTTDPKYRARDEKLLAHLRAELDRRSR